MSLSHVIFIQICECYVMSPSTLPFPNTPSNIMQYDAFNLSDGFIGSIDLKPLIMTSRTGIAYFGDTFPEHPQMEMNQFLHLASERDRHVYYIVFLRVVADETYAVTTRVAPLDHPLIHIRRSANFDVDLFLRTRALFKNWSLGSTFGSDLLSLRMNKHIDVARAILKCGRPFKSCLELSVQYHSVYISILG